ncbi:YebC/PmpR family DNA-binding transcriptional regulator [Patescibacteria group bacterium]|nr:YebC/PmpR family DNA-binding transcriptional regulator [Patescibacteria group bacterium]
MSGHSKWSTIKHKKAASDAKKGKEFTRASNLISLAARDGGDPGMNPALAMAIEKAKAVNMPKANIERAIKKGTGELGGDVIGEVIYEGYGPEGVAILIETATDNKNRTVSEIRAALTKSGGSMASSGAVAYLFENRGQIEIKKENQILSDDEIELAIIESGASDFQSEKGLIFVYTEPKELMAVKKILEESGIKISGAELSYVPKNEVTVNEKEKAEKIIALVEALEELDDVVSVHANLDIPSEVLEQIR